MMIITRKALPRRTFLRGCGVALALPLLDAMAPAMKALAQSAARPVRRVGFVYFPHGANGSWAPEPLQWKPRGVGSDFEFSNILKPLEPFRQHLVIVSKLYRGHDIGHWNAPAWLGGVDAVRQTEGADFRANITLDQVLAKHLGQSTGLPSLELATEDFTGYVGACDVGYSCAYYNTTSWASPTNPLPMDIDPRSVFERLFGEPGTTAQRNARLQQGRSVLDSIKEDIDDLTRRVGPRDRDRLAQYMDNVREIERRISRAEVTSSADVVLRDAPVGIPETFEEHATLMFDLLALAYQADMTRIASFMMCRELSQRTYVEISGLTDPHHSMSHHQNDPKMLTGLAQIQRHYVDLFSKFVGKLKETPDGDGSLLDHSLIAFGSGMGNSNGHLPDELPLVLVGGAAGIAGNRHVEASQPHTPIANLWLTLADKFDAPLDSLGNSTGRFAI
jgi:hypothetical protein